MVARARARRFRRSAPSNRRPDQSHRRLGKRSAPEGEPSETSAPPPAEDWQLGPPDLVLNAPQPFSPPADGPDVFWNFPSSRPDLPFPRYVRAVEIRAGGKRLVHHANLIVDRMNSARKLEKSPGAGFGGMDLNIRYSVFDPPGHFLFWKPGARPAHRACGLPHMASPAWQRSRSERAPAAVGKTRAHTSLPLASTSPIRPPRCFPS